MEWYYVWWPWLTYKHVAQVCQHQLSFLFSIRERFSPASMNRQSRNLLPRDTNEKLYFTAVKRYGTYTIKLIWLQNKLKWKKEIDDSLCTRIFEFAKFIAHKLLTNSELADFLQRYPICSLKCSSKLLHAMAILHCAPEKKWEARFGIFRT